MPEGVIITDLGTAVKDHPELVEKYFMNREFPGGDNKMVALNAALHSGGLFVYVPEGVRVKTPIEFFVWIDAAGVGVFDHSIVVAEPRSRVTVVETALSPQDLDKAYRYGVLDVFVGERSAGDAEQRAGFGRQRAKLGGAPHRTRPAQPHRLDFGRVRRRAVRQRNRQPSHRPWQRGAGLGRVLRVGQAAPGSGAA